MLEVESCREKLPKQTADGRIYIFDEATWIQLLDAIVQADTGFEGRGVSGLRDTILDDLLLPKNLRTKKATKAILRMLTLHVQDWWSIKKLKDSLKTIASIMAEQN